MKKPITAMIITIGDELLMGQTVDTNSAFLGKQLNELGIDVIEVHSISDKREAILDAWTTAKNKVDIIFTTGGLGPTNDDITKKVFAEFCQSNLTLNKQAQVWLEDFFSKVIKREMNDLNRSQAFLPKITEPLQNKIGTAPGMWTKMDDRIFVHMPGVPTEMKALFFNEVMPRLKQNFDFTYIINRNIYFINLPESTLAEQLKDFEEKLPSALSIAYLPSGKRVRLRLTARGESKEYLIDLLNKAVEEIVKTSPEYIYSIKEQSLEELVGKLLIKKKYKIASAESFTSGNIAKKLTSVSGSSAYFEGSIIAYSKEQKVKQLDVEQNLINNYSTVCEAVALQMARGVLNRLNVDIAISSTGVAGPNPDEFGNKVGIAFIAIATKDKEIVKQFYYPSLSREDFVHTITNLSIENLYRFLIK